MTQTKLQEHLTRHISRLESKIAERERVNSIFSRVRLGYVLVVIFSVIFYYDYVSPALFVASIFGWAIGFLVILHNHRKVYQSLEKFEHLRDIKKEHIARIQLDWQGIRFRETDLELRNHPFAQDFNIPGRHSIHHLMDTSIYPGSGKRLLEWLTESNPKKETTLQRQAKVKELTSLMAFRDKLRVINLFSTLHVSEKDWTLDQMLEWLRRPEKQGIKTPLMILAGLSALNIILAMLVFTIQFSPIFLLISLLTYLVYYKGKSGLVVDLFDSAFNMEKILTRFKAALLHLEAFKFPNKPNVAGLLSPFHDENTRPSDYVRKIESLMSRAALQVNQFLWGVVNLAIPWDLYHVYLLEKMRAEFEGKFSVWVDIFYELEALNSLANFSDIHPGYCWPEFDEGSPMLFAAENLGHPLIPTSQKVTNNFQVEPGKDLFLLTGSNMAGKSTFLRTVGVNLVLANAGAPVNATMLKTRYFRLFSSININDSLDDGLSHFYAEVKRLRALLDEIDRPHEFPLFFFVDEIYKGTNNRERYAGSAAFLKKVAEKPGVGMVSSHDLELADLDAEILRLSNWHFSETIEDGKMSFEYTLKPGPCPSTNALHIMRMEGLPVQ